MTAAERAAERNAATRAWIAADPENRGAFLLTEDAAHWAKDGIETGEQLDRYLAVQAYWDAYKDAYHIKPRLETLEGLSTEEIEDLTERIYEQNAHPVQDTSPLTHNPFASLK